jgi:hypothetical protein
MAVPRPILLALLGTVLLAVTFMATMTTRDKVADQTQTPALTQTPAPAQPTPAKALTGADALKAIWSPGKPIESGEFDIRWNAQELAGKHQRQAIRLTGNFKSGQAGKLPSFNLKTSDVKNGKATHEHVVSTGDAGYVFKGTGATAFALGQTTVANLTASRDAIAKGTVGPTAEVPAPDVASWVKNAKVTDSNIQLDGVKTTHVVGAIAPKAVAADVRRIAKTVGGSDSQVNLPNHLNAKVRDALKTARVEAWIGTDDRIVRRLSIDVRGKFPPEMLDKGDTPRWHMGLDVSLTKVNKPQEIGKPANVGKAAPRKALGAKLARSSAGTFALGALFTDPPASLLKTSAALLEGSQQSRAQRKPRAVSRAVQNHKRVVIFFKQPNGLDDAATDDAVVALRKRSSAIVYSDSVANVAQYGQVVMSVGVTRAPSIVIIGKSGRARLIEGYIESGALAQEVADTR